MPRLSRLTIVYLTLVFALASWAGYAELLYSDREHLLPAVALCVATLPSSLLTNLVLPYFPALNTPFVGLGWLVICGILQAVVLQLISGGWRPQR